MLLQVLRKESLIRSAKLDNIKCLLTDTGIPDFSQTDSDGRDFLMYLALSNDFEMIRDIMTHVKSLVQMPHEIVAEEEAELDDIKKS